MSLSLFCFFHVMGRLILFQELKVMQTKFYYSSSVLWYYVLLTTMLFLLAKAKQELLAEVARVIAYSQSLRRKIERRKILNQRKLWQRGESKHFSSFVRKIR